MASIRFKLNGQDRQLEVDPDTPLLWVLRDELKLTGTKYSCGIGICGSCTVHLDGKAVRSCSLPVSRAAGHRVDTIEGLAANSGGALQKAWIEEEVPSCGYCQPGQLMAAAALLKEKPKPTDADIDAAMRGVLCRCGTYLRIRRAIHRAAEEV